MAGLAAASAGCAASEEISRITLATTSSVENSGLLRVLLPAFEAHAGVQVDVTTPGSGRALAMLERAEADVALSHAPDAEAALLSEMDGWLYRKVMFNDFIVVGPPDDPAGVKRAVTIEDAMRALARSQARFISRGDSSGTHERELFLWELAGLIPDPVKVVAAGSGMGATLRIAGNVEGYTLSDRATFAHHSGRGDLAILFEGGPHLINSYAVITPAEAPPQAFTLAEWLTDGDGRQIIDEYRTSSGVRAFTPWPAGCPREAPADAPCPPTAMGR